jgi:hypothetical protein
VGNRVVDTQHATGEERSSHLCTKSYHTTLSKGFFIYVLPDMYCCIVYVM